MEMTQMADLEERGIRGESEGSLRNYKFRGKGGSEETKGGTLKFLSLHSPGTY